MLYYPLIAPLCTGPIRLQPARVPERRHSEGDRGQDAGDTRRIHQRAGPRNLPTPPLAGPGALQEGVVSQNKLPFQSFPLTIIQVLV